MLCERCAEPGDWVSYRALLNENNQSSTAGTALSKLRSLVNFCLLERLIDTPDDIFGTDNQGPTLQLVTRFIIRKAATGVLARTIRSNLFLWHTVLLERGIPTFWD